MICVLFNWPEPIPQRSDFITEILLDFNGKKELSSWQKRRSKLVALSKLPYVRPLTLPGAKSVGKPLPERRDLI